MPGKRGSTGRSTPTRTVGPRREWASPGAGQAAVGIARLALEATGVPMLHEAAQNMAGTYGTLRPAPELAFTAPGRTEQAAPIGPWGTGFRGGWRTGPAKTYEQKIRERALKRSFRSHTALQEGTDQIRSLPTAPLSMDMMVKRAQITYDMRNRAKLESGKRKAFADQFQAALSDARSIESPAMHLFKMPSENRRAIRQIERGMAGGKSREGADLLDTLFELDTDEAFRRIGGDERARMTAPYFEQHFPSIVEAARDLIVRNYLDAADTKFRQMPYRRAGDPAPRPGELEEIAELYRGAKQKYTGKPGYRMNRAHGTIPENDAAVLAAINERIKTIYRMIGTQKLGTKALDNPKLTPQNDIPDFLR